MQELDLCPKCDKRLLPVIEKNTSATARCCQGCKTVFEIKDGQHVEHLDQDAKESKT